MSQDLLRRPREVERDNLKFLACIVYPVHSRSALARRVDQESRGEARGNRVGQKLVEIWVLDTLYADPLVLHVSDEHALAAFLPGDIRPEVDQACFVQAQTRSALN